MSRKKRKYEMNIPDADKYIVNLKYKDLKRECILRGMDFDRALSAGIPELINWLRNNLFIICKPELLELFDNWQEEKLKQSSKEKGEDPNLIIHPSLRLGYIAERDDDGTVVKRKRARTIFKKKRKRRERTSEGIFSGTKKAYTFELQKAGKSKMEIIKLVLEKYPNASEKSIGIWFNKSKKLNA